MAVFASFLQKKLLRIRPAVLLLALIYICSSATFFSNNIVQICISARKLNNLYCLTDGARPSSEIPLSLVNDEENGDFGIKIHAVNNSSGEGGTETVDYANREVEGQLQMHRSWISDANGARSCEGGGVYVYELPSKFNTELLAQCDGMIPWLNFCKYLSNDGLGEVIEKLGNGWYDTHQYALEPIFHARVIKHPCRVYNQSEAKLFYVPYYGGLDVLRWHFKEDVSNEVKDVLGLELIRWLESQGPWNKKLGKDHVFVLGKISWDFRRKDRSTWGSSFLELDVMQNPIKLLIERHPWHVNDIGVPHPTHFHPRTDEDMLVWQLRVIKSKRSNTISFAGATRPDSSGSIRSALIEQCSSATSGECRFLNCKSGQCDRPESIIELFIESEFCLQPPGDSATRKSVFDSLMSGCIPVLFDPMTAYYQYPWHLPEDRHRYSVFIDKDEVRNNTVNVVQRLSKIPHNERENMRRYIVYQLLPGLVYGDFNSKFDKFEDAFSISINNLLHRVTRLIFNNREQFTYDT